MIPGERSTGSRRKHDKKRPSPATHAEWTAAKAKKELLDAMVSYSSPTTSRRALQQTDYSFNNKGMFKLYYGLLLLT
jgi:hypothetical protein